jgi:catechol 2,3-dioxygenase-like lactoylglutathione lyase family enzyme
LHAPQLPSAAVWVRDLDSVCDFYARYFGAKIGSRYENPAKGFASRFLVFESGARIEVMTTKGARPAPHTFGRRLRVAGVSFEDRQDLLGHRSTRVTTDYSAAELRNLLTAANRLKKSRKSPAMTVLPLTG